MSLINNTQQKIIKRVIIVTLIFSGIFLIFIKNPTKYVYGLIFGSTINVLNFRLMSLTLEKSVHMAQHKVMPYVVTNYIVRYLIYGIVLSIAAIADYLSVFTVIIGFFMVKVIIITDTFFNMVSKKTN